MNLQAIAAPPGAEHIHHFEDPVSGARGVIVVDSTVRGPAMGGCRLWRYASDADMLLDATRLARGMSYKNAVAGLALGGGKAAINMPDGAFDRASLFRAFGRAVEELGGSYLAAEDVGTSVADMQIVRSATPHVFGLPAGDGLAGGDPSPWTALGTFVAMQVAAEWRGRGLGDMTVIVQGLGNVGRALCELLSAEGANLVVADIDPAREGEVADRFGAWVASAEEIHAAPGDIYAPCALGATLNAKTIPAIQASIVCGAANNQLARPEDREALAARGILYAPDYVVNAGGIINVAAEYLGEGPDLVRARVQAIGPKLRNILQTARDQNVTPAQAADQLAASLLTDVRCVAA